MCFTIINSLIQHTKKLKNSQRIKILNFFLISKGMKMKHREMNLHIIEVNGSMKKVQYIETSFVGMNYISL